MPIRLKKPCLKILVIFTFLLISACSLSKENIIETVKTSMQSKFSTDDQFKAYDLKVESLQILSKGGNQYSGIAQILYAKKLHDVSVDITVDGTSVMWQVAPGGFLFVMQ